MYFFTEKRSQNKEKEPKPEKPLESENTKKESTKSTAIEKKNNSRNSATLNSRKRYVLHVKQIWFSFWIFYPVNEMLFLVFIYMGNMGGVAVRPLASHYCDLGLISGLSVICELSLLLILSACFEGCSPVFLPLQKSTFLNSNWIQWKKSQLCGTTVNSYLFILFLFSIQRNG
jgi:hypothetical protein